MKRPYVMHLDRVCRDIEKERIMLVEINPDRSDIDVTPKIFLADLKVLNDMLVGWRDPYIRPVPIVFVKESTGEIYKGTLTTDSPKMTFTVHPKIRLSSYGRAWRCWDCGTPTMQQRESAKWR